MAPSLRSRLQTCAAELNSAAFVESVLQGIGTDEDLVSFVHRFTVFCGDFAGGVANLVGALHVRWDLFRDSSEEVFHCADRGAEIASHVFFAAEDEYADRLTGARVTHRQLAQMLLREIMRYVGMSASVLNRGDNVADDMAAIIDDIKRGYLLGASYSDDELFSALGFHIGAEWLADKEFRAIDRFLARRHPALREHLKATEVLQGMSAYHWIGLHTLVEKEHLEHGVVAAKKAICYYQGQLSRAELENLVMHGFRAFGCLQRRFFASSQSAMKRTHRSGRRR
jgi:hypothetical protein